MCKNVKKWVEKCAWYDILLVKLKVNKYEKVRTKEIGRMEKQRK